MEDAGDKNTHKFDNLAEKYPKHIGVEPKKAFLDIG
jgi:hypothetical protein